MNLLVLLTTFQVRCSIYVRFLKLLAIILLSENVVVGDLVIRPDKTFGGGALNLTGNFDIEKIK